MAKANLKSIDQTLSACIRSLPAAPEPGRLPSGVFKELLVSKKKNDW